MADIENLVEREGGGPCGCYIRGIQKLWGYVSIAGDPLFTLDKTLIKLGHPDITKEEERAAYVSSCSRCAR